MRRRQFILGSGLALGATVSTAGCLGGSPAPPRKSAVFEEIEIQNEKLAVQIPNDVWVQSRANVGNSGNVEADGLGGLSPVGVARGAKGGAGATGRGAGGAIAAPTTQYGYAKWHGGDGDDYDGWRNNNGDDVDKYDATVASVGVAYLASDAGYEDNAPPAGPVNWDNEVDSVSTGQQLSWNSSMQDGWYRVGAHLKAKNGNHDFGWEAVDFEVDNDPAGPRIDTEWKISPRL